MLSKFDYYVKVKSGKGFTLTEILIALSIMALLTTVSLITFVSFKNQETLAKDSNLVVEVLRQAKSQTLNSRDSFPYGVHFDSGSITLFIGPTYSAVISTNQIYDLNPDTNISSVVLNGGGNDLLFKKLSGSTDNNGTITLTSRSSGKFIDIKIYKTGLVE